MHFNCPLKINHLFSKINSRVLLYCILTCELINVVYFAIFFYSKGYLPAPFVWDKYDTFMDFYNPLYWVIKDGFYTTFQSVYPPLNYYFLKFFAWGADLNATVDRFELRNSHIGLSIFLCSIYIAILLIVTNIGQWRKVKLGNPILIWIACICSVPVLFALERGNIIFIALLFLACYLATENRWLKAIFFGLLVNIKPYFIILLIQYINFYSFNKLDLLRCIFLAAIIFISTGLMVGLNILDFISSYYAISSQGGIGDDGLLALPNTLASLYPLKNIIYYSFNSPNSTYAFWFSCLKLMAIITPLVLFLLTVFRPLSATEKIIAALVLIANFSHVVGGYIFIIYILLIPYLYEKSIYKSLLILSLIILCLPVDIIRINFIPIYFPVNSYLSGGITLDNNILFLGLGTIIRPIANYLIMLTLIIKFLKKYPLSMAFLRSQR